MVSGRHLIFRYLDPDGAQMSNDVCDGLLRAIMYPFLGMS